MHISDTLDDICQKMNDYVRAIKKYNKKLTIFNLMTPSGGMNPQMSKVDVIHDGDLNKSLEFYVSFAYIFCIFNLLLLICSNIYSAT